MKQCSFAKLIWFKNEKVVSSGIDSSYRFRFHEMAVKKKCVHISVLNITVQTCLSFYI